MGRPGGGGTAQFNYLTMFSGDRSWVKRASCAGLATSFFFPDNNQVTPEHKQVCFNCPVKVECLEYALKNQTSLGVWAGTSESDRRRIRRKGINKAG